MDAKLVLQRRHAQVVGLGQRAAGIDQALGHDEQRNAARARRRVRRAGEHEMDDVLGHVVIAIGDEDLWPGDQIALAIGNGAAAQRPDIGARLGLGQVHGAGPLARR